MFYNKSFFSGDAEYFYVLSGKIAEIIDNLIKQLFNELTNYLCRLKKFKYLQTSFFFLILDWLFSFLKGDLVQNKIFCSRMNQQHGMNIAGAS